MVILIQNEWTQFILKHSVNFFIPVMFQVVTIILFESIGGQSKLQLTGKEEYDFHAMIQM